MRPPDAHLHFHELISDQIDRALPAAENEDLREHLSLCARCRMVEREYRRVHRQLRDLPERPVPRDLWARTAAALDHEMMRHPARPGRRHGDDGAPRRAAPRSSGSPALMLTALASLLVGVAVVGTQLNRTITLPPPSSAPQQAAEPTPFQVPSQPLAFVAVTPAGLAIYEARIDRSCPAASPDCAEISAARQRVVVVPGEQSANDIDLHGANGRMALTTADARGNDTVSVVLLPTMPPNPGDDVVAGTTPLPSAAPTPDGSATLPVASPTTPSSTTDPQDPPTHHPGGPTGSPTAPTGSGGIPTPSQPSSTSGSPATSQAPDGSNGGTEPSAPGGSTTGSSASPGSTDSPAPTPAAVQAVMADVRVVGAPPAWSADGETLAFSAMPADLSRGPDIYVWRSGDTGATRVTRDHGSYFASWSGSRIVASRASDELAPDGTTQVVARTVVIDPVTGSQRTSALVGSWLPSVDPTGRLAIVWRGDLQHDGQMVVPGHGALYMVEWASIDPYATSQPTSSGSGGPTQSPTAEPTPDASSEVPPDETPDATPAPSSDPSASPSASPDASRAPHRNPSRSRPHATPVPTPPTAAPSAPDAAAPVPLEPDRDIRADPVREWRIGWADDGSAFGFWVTETPGSTWGQLAVYLVDASSDSIDRESAVLPATLAERAFSLGEDRVAWVAPSDGQPQGELRLRTWGARGYGGLRIRDIDVSPGLPAF